MEDLAQIGWMGTSVTAQQDTQEHYAKLVSLNASIMILIMIMINIMIIVMIMIMISALAVSLK